MNRRRTRRSKRKGAGKIGEGMTGTVFYPALDCDDPSKQPKGDYVSKVMNPVKAQAEFSKAERLRTLAPPYAIYPEALCESNGKTLLFSKYGGFNLADYSTNLEQVYYGKRLRWAPPPVPVDKEELTNIVSALFELAKDIEFMNKEGLYHNDVSMDNIVFNPKTKKAYLIDFEHLSDVSKGIRDTETIHGIANDFKEYSQKEPVMRF